TGRRAVLGEQRRDLGLAGPAIGACSQRPADGLDAGQSLICDRGHDPVEPDPETGAYDRAIICTATWHGPGQQPGTSPLIKPRFVEQGSKPTARRQPRRGRCNEETPVEPPAPYRGEAV